MLFYGSAVACISVFRSCHTEPNRLKPQPEYSHMFHMCLCAITYRGFPSFQELGNSILMTGKWLRKAVMINEFLAREDRIVLLLLQPASRMDVIIGSQSLSISLNASIISRSGLTLPDRCQVARPNNIVRTKISKSKVTCSPVKMVIELSDKHCS